MKNLNKIEGKIKKLDYPFLKDLSQLPNEVSVNFLNQINEIARKVYLKDNEDSIILYSYKELRKIYNKSPKSWRVYENKNYVKGYIHVQAITEKIGEKLLNGKISEDDIRVKDILKDDNNTSKGYIHIGSIALKEHPTTYLDSSMPLLIAGIIDRIIELRNLNPNLNKIIAVAFEDHKGDNHFLKFLPLYGFNYINKTKDSDNIYSLDLDNNKERNFSNLIEIVSAKRNKFYKRNRKIKKIKRIFSLKYIKDFIKFFTKRYNEIKNEPNKSLDDE